MLADTSMVTMKMLSNHKGISLVVLLVAITLISILGVSFVSLMTSKQKSFLHQVDSYRALNIAHAGIEYAIRFASDGLDNNGNSIFFSNPNLSTTGKSLGGGAFAINYTYNQAINNDFLTIMGTYKGSSRTIRLSRFRRYISPITLIPNDAPRFDPANSSQVIVPVICNNEVALAVSRVDISVNASNIYLKVMRSGVNLFDYDSSAYPECGTPICKINDAPQEQRILLSGSMVRFDLLPGNQHSQDEMGYYVLQFSSTAPAGQYRIDFYTSLPNGNPFTIRFSL